ncbi:unnamed protein product [Arctia plantaginis]|uniref:Uncharacterized protein n=1 Tax=Arctia plantaginis TaxID=874455 RepID=A0A8S0Z0J2_ARCPL|nr:unnamed protein product [Arctia plantaginis]CAB3253670.1 unnamed protein product [Arctia plantaginis]
MNFYRSVHHPLRMFRRRLARESFVFRHVPNNSVAGGRGRRLSALCRWRAYTSPYLHLAKQTAAHITRVVGATERGAPLPGSLGSGSMFFISVYLIQ